MFVFARKLGNSFRADVENIHHPVEDMHPPMCDSAKTFCVIDGNSFSVLWFSSSKLPWFSNELPLRSFYRNKSDGISSGDREGRGPQPQCAQHILAIKHLPCSQRWLPPRHVKTNPLQQRNKMGQNIPIPIAFCVLYSKNKQSHNQTSKFCSQSVCSSLTQYLLVRIRIVKFFTKGTERFRE